MNDRKHHEHTAEAINARLQAGPIHSYIRDWVYGGIDGAVTTFAVVAGVMGAGLSTTTILVLGVANLIADGFSMAASNFLGTKTEAEELKHWEEFERKQIVADPEGEKLEVRQILEAKGFEGELLDSAVDIITSNPDKWIQIMLTEEYGLPLQIRSPFKAAFSTYLAFVVCGGLPLIPFLAGSTNAFLYASLLVGLTFFLVGSMKSLWTVTPWWRSGLISLLVGAAASGLAYGVGVLLKPVVG